MFEFNRVSVLGLYSNGNTSLMVFDDFGNLIPISDKSMIFLIDDVCNHIEPH